MSRETECSGRSPWTSYPRRRAGWGSKTNTKKIKKLVEELIVSRCGEGARIQVKGSKKACLAVEETSDATRRAVI